ncbi:MAG: bifunctional proline dehydrogenase/L-glutamate gamma-semialdehyde dehydrogenase [Rickettsiales bacterium]|nr:bifunctional proline dehydrogenase/L-glutamate gamma-semialdehyde dehydrogenase [Rickettsiales bacterium]|tara:strand:+ start:2821 stop:6000 length:3180 start_codon:yes stop_codon:yes gene_type:complete
MAKNALKNNNETLDLSRTEIQAHYHTPEVEATVGLLDFVENSELNLKKVQARAEELIDYVRNAPRKTVTIENFLAEYGLTTDEGIALMCLAEALLRVPDSRTANRLIEDKLGSADWDSHIEKANDLFLSLSSWGLMLSGKVVKEERDIMGASKKSMLGRVVKRMGEPVIRNAMLQAMKILGQQFVMGQTIEAAIKRAVSMEKKGYRYSYDMLGEASRTFKDADRYFNSYADALEKIGQNAVETKPNGSSIDRSGISVKLSALHPRYMLTKSDTCVPFLVAKLKELSLRAKHYDIGLTVDAEECSRLDISLDVIEQVFLDPELDGWEGFGIALQAYQKRAFYVIDWLEALSKKAGRKIMVRLVKGAYWDTEIKHAQTMGDPGFPVFTRKVITDLSYNACAVKLLSKKDVFYPQLATHNAYTAATILHLAEENNLNDYEFQRLHGMGEPLYDSVKENYHAACRIYAPVGTHKDLLPYLVRRMLENGANSSFVNKVTDKDVPIVELVTPPQQKIREFKQIAHPKIPLPIDILNTRANSSGFDIEDRGNRDYIEGYIQSFKSKKKKFEIGSLIDGKTIKSGAKIDITNPSRTDHILGDLYLSDESVINKAIDTAQDGYKAWSKTPAAERADALEKLADLLEENRDELIAICALEAGKTLDDCVDEVREAVDFCRYYAFQGRNIFAGPIELPGPTGESNTLSYHSRGVWACISPWNFPLAIFTGQVVAALMAGNSVIAKPAEQTSLVAYRAVELMHEAGIPASALQLVLGKGSMVGPILTADERIKGFAFTGSVPVAKQINREIAAREGAIIPLIAETGGQNCMIVDNTALAEQVTDDVIRSAFQSAGQRCSAMRVLFLQEEIAPIIIEMLTGAMEAVDLGDPTLAFTDVGPVIDERALKGLKAHVEKLEKDPKAKLIHKLETPKDLDGTFMPPHLFEIEDLDQLEEEVFGPIAHIIRYKGEDLNKVLKKINDTGFGLTLGIHTRIDFAAHDISQHVNVGNIYVNRNMVGAVVGVQPFGGEGLSGTGPKAGGPSYLLRFATERAISVNTTASGGNASLISLTDE